MLAHPCADVFPTYFPGSSSATWRVLGLALPARFRSPSAQPERGLSTPASKDVGDVLFNRALAHHQLTGNLPIRLALGDQRRDLTLTAGQPPPLSAFCRRQSRRAAELPHPPARSCLPPPLLHSCSGCQPATASQVMFVFHARGCPGGNASAAAANRRGRSSRAPAAGSPLTTPGRQSPSGIPPPRAYCPGPAASRCSRQIRPCALESPRCRQVWPRLCSTDARIAHGIELAQQHDALLVGRFAPPVVLLAAPQVAREVERHGNPVRVPRLPEQRQAFLQHGVGPLIFTERHGRKAVDAQGHAQLVRLLTDGSAG